jgi:MFS transporter, UMF1 family
LKNGRHSLSKDDDQIDMTNHELDKPRLLAVLSWILYDFADTAFSMNIVSLYFSTWIIINLHQSDAYVSFANSFSMILVALTMPVLGDWSDHKGRKLLPLALFSGVCIVGTALIGILGYYLLDVTLLMILVILVFVVTNYGYQGALVFYNALLPSVSTPRTVGRISGYGVGIGYLGAVFGLMVARIFVEGNFYGLEIPGIDGGGTVAVFMPTALFYLLFAVPLFLFVREPFPTSNKTSTWSVKDSYKKIFRTLADTQKHPGLLRFLIATLLYSDSIETVILFMGIYVQSVVGFNLAETNNFFILVIPSAIAGSAICGILTDHYGPKKTLNWVILLWVAAMIAIISTDNRTMFWILGGAVGALMGSTWTASRPLLISLVPKENLGEFFGLYALSGKVAAVIGPLLWSTVTFIFRDYGDHFKYKAAIAVLAINMLIGWVVLLKVPDHKPER